LCLSAARTVRGYLFPPDVMFPGMVKAVTRTKARAQANKPPATGDVHPGLAALVKYLARRAAERDHKASREHSRKDRPCGGNRDSKR